MAKKFTFLGYEFRPRLVRSRQGKLFVAFTPALSPRAAKRMRQRDSTMAAESPNESNPGGDRTRSESDRERLDHLLTGPTTAPALYPILRHIDQHLVQVGQTEMDKKRGRYFKRAKTLAREGGLHYRPKLFVHWQFGAAFSAE